MFHSVAEICGVLMSISQCCGVFLCVLCFLLFRSVDGVLRGVAECFLVLRVAAECFLVFLSVAD